MIIIIIIIIIIFIEGAQLAKAVFSGALMRKINVCLDIPCDSEIILVFSGQIFRANEPQEHFSRPKVRSQ